MRSPIARTVRPPAAALLAVGALLALACQPAAPAEPDPSREAPAASRHDRLALRKISAPSADLQMRATVAPSATRTGQPLAFILSVLNSGPSPSTSIQVLFDLPSGSTLLDTAGDGWTCQLVPNRELLGCTRAQLAVGPAPELIVDLLPDPAATFALGSATVSSSDTTDPDSANDGATASATITYDPSGLRTAAFAGGGFGCSQSGGRAPASLGLFAALCTLLLLSHRQGRV